jgi:hypothetical protein
MIRIFSIIAITILPMGCSAFAMGKKADNEQGAQAPQIQNTNDLITGVVYRQRYTLANASQKLVDNQGDGRGDLYGVRNFRAVLNGVYYRGGANNAYNKQGEKRGNSNPLPNGGLKNLCEEGFTQAIYLYPTNFSSAAKTTRCRTYNNEENVLNYAQISPLSYRRDDQKKLLTLINDHIRNPRLGPIYDHCWNGWHASGFVAAITLRQFCGFSADQAVAYWNVNTDGINKGASYDTVRKNIRNFVPFSEFSISEAEKAALCPDPSSLKFL